MIFILPFCLLCVFVSLCCVCECVLPKNGLMVVCSMLALSHTRIAGGSPHLGQPGCQLKPLHTHIHTYTQRICCPSLSLWQPRFGSFVHSLLSSGFIVNVFRKLFSLESANKMAESAVCPLTHSVTICLPVLSVRPPIHLSLSLTLSLSAGQVL